MNRMAQQYLLTVKTTTIRTTSTRMFLITTTERLRDIQSSSTLRHEITHLLYCLQYHLRLLCLCLLSRTSPLPVRPHCIPCIDPAFNASRISPLHCPFHFLEEKPINISPSTIRHASHKPVSCKHSTRPGDTSTTRIACLISSVKSLSHRSCAAIAVSCIVCASDPNRY